MCRIAEQRQPSLASRSAAARGHTAPIGTSSRPAAARSDARVPACELAAKHVGIAGRGPGFLHLLISRHEADVVDHRPARTGKVRKCLPLPSHISQRVGRPVRHAIVRDHAPIGDGCREKTGVEGGVTYVAQLRVDAVGGNDDIAFRDGAVGERHPGDVAVLLEADAAVAGMHDVRRAGRRRGNRRGRRGACRRSRSSPRSPSPAPGRSACRRGESSGSRTDSGAKFLDRRAEAHPLKLAHAVRRQEHARADLAECGRLLIDRDPKSMRDQRVGSEQAADAATDDHDLQPLLGHHQAPRATNGCDRAEYCVVSSHGVEECRHQKAPDKRGERKGVHMRDIVEFRSLMGRIAVGLALCLAAIQWLRKPGAGRWLSRPDRKNHRAVPGRRNS